MVVTVDIVPFVTGAVVAVAGQCGSIVVLRQLNAEIDRAYKAPLTFKQNGRLLRGAVGDAVPDLLETKNLVTRVAKDIDAITAGVSAIALGTSVLLLFPNGYTVTVGLILSALALIAFIVIWQMDAATYDLLTIRSVSIVTAVFVVLNVLAIVFALILAWNGLLSTEPIPTGTASAP